MVGRHGQSCVRTWRYGPSTPASRAKQERGFLLALLLTLGGAALIFFAYLGFEEIANLAEEAEPQLTRQDRVAWLARLEQEVDNLRAMLDRLTVDASAEAAGATLMLDIDGSPEELRDVDWPQQRVTCPEGHASCAACCGAASRRIRSGGCTTSRMRESRSRNCASSLSVGTASSIGTESIRIGHTAYGTKLRSVSSRRNSTPPGLAKIWAIDFPAAASFEQYGAGFASKGDWRRNNMCREA